ncbi:M20 family peptidase [Paenibacillaceae bacterium]|nr:M20 family peptidase [Paenibacillaceae bacterium]
MLLSDIIYEYEEQIIYHLRKLIQIRSVWDEAVPGRPNQPYGEGVDEALQYMLRLGEELGFQVKNIDGYAGHVEYGSGEELIAVLVHLDTVHEGDGWTYPPFGAVIDHGKIFGRGASDDKGAAVVALFALKALQKIGVAPSKRVRIIFGTHEESGMQDMDYYFAREQKPDLAFTPDAGYPIFNRELGNINVAISWQREQGVKIEMEEAEHNAAQSENAEQNAALTLVSAAPVTRTADNGVPDIWTAGDEVSVSRTADNEVPVTRTGDNEVAVTRTGDNEVAVTRTGADGVRLLTMEGGKPFSFIPERCEAVFALSSEHTERAMRVLSNEHNIELELDTDKNLLRVTASNLPLEQTAGTLAAAPAASPTNAIVNMISWLHSAKIDQELALFYTYLHERIGKETNGNSLGIRCEDDVSGPLQVYLRTIRADTRHIEALVNIRYPVTKDGDEIMRTITDTLPFPAIKVDERRHLKPVYVPADHPLIQKLGTAYRKVTGEQAELLQMGAGTYSRKLPDRCVAFGPGLPGAAHTNVHAADEYIEIASLMKHATICAQGIYELICEP